MPLRISLAVGTSVLASLMACNAHTAGRKYTFAKMDADRRSFVEFKTVLPERTDGYDQLVRHGEYIGISLNSGFLRFLNDAERPEVAIFARVRITPLESPDESYVVEGVYLHSEGQDDIQLEGDAYFPRLDIPLMPGLKYEGQDIQVQLRIIEIDGDDRARTKSLINSAASVAAAFRPEAASTISVFQTVLSFLNDQNRDDIEFQFDFGLSESAQPIVYTWQTDPDQPSKEERYDLVLQPRVATYVVIKTEHPRRLNISGNHFDIAHGGVRYVAGQALKVATLGVFNWSMWNGTLNADPDEDFYLAIMGRPFGIPREAWREPKWNTRKLTVDRAGQGVLAGLSVPHALTLENHELVATSSLNVPCDPLSARIGSKPPFDDQGYIIVSVTRPTTGIDLTKLRTLDDWKRKLEFDTKQLSPEEFAGSLDGITSALKGVAEERAKKAADKKRSADERAVASIEKAATTHESYRAALIDSGVPQELQDASLERMASVFAARAEALQVNAAPYAYGRVLGPRLIEVAEAESATLSILLATPATPQFQIRTNRSGFAPVVAGRAPYDGDVLHRVDAPLERTEISIEVQVIAVDSSGQRIGAPMTRVYIRDSQITELRVGAEAKAAQSPVDWSDKTELHLHGSNLAWRNPASEKDEPFFTQATVRVKEGDGPERDFTLDVEVEKIGRESILRIRKSAAVPAKCNVTRITPVARPESVVDFGAWPLLNAGNGGTPPGNEK
jgi:hypothetical protein